MYKINQSLSTTERKVLSFKTFLQRSGPTLIFHNRKISRKPNLATWRHHVRLFSHHRRAIRECEHIRCAGITNLPKTSSSAPDPENWIRSESHLDDRSMDSVNSSCTGKKLGCVSGGDDERRLKRKLNVGNDAGSKDKAQTASSGSVEIAVSPGSSSSGNSVDIDSEVSGEFQESSSPIGLAADENVPVSTQVREESRVVESLNTISDSIVGEGGSLGTVIKSQSFKGMNEATHTSKKRTPPSKMQWPKWPVLHMVRLSNMEKVMNYYRALNLGKDMDDKDLLCFLEEQLAKEKAGLSKTTITNRLRTKLHESAAAGEPDSCSICMGEYKEQDEIANLYYCSHQYHAECIKEWLPKNNLCPMCRALAIIPEEYPSWDGDVRLHQAFFVHVKYAAA